VTNEQDLHVFECIDRAGAGPLDLGLVGKGSSADYPWLRRLARA
jgi:hypothetical protein